jgi:hypothetical protein
MESLVRVIEAVAAAIVLAILTVVWNWISDGGVIRWLGGVTKKEFQEIARAPTSLPGGLIVAFNGPCPSSGWRPFAPAVARFVLGAGTPSDPIKKWRRELPTGGSEEIDLTSRQVGETGGEENHVLKVAELARHAHNTYRTRGEPGVGDGKYPSWKAMSSPAEPIDVPTQETGGNQPHNNMPPFIALTYCEKI